MMGINKKKTNMKTNKNPQQQQKKVLYSTFINEVQNWSKTSQAIITELIRDSNSFQQAV